MLTKDIERRPGASGDEAALCAVISQLVDAWNAGRGDAFAAPFAEDADFVAFDGTHLRGRSEIESFHQRLFDSVLRGTRLWGEVKFVHIYPSGWAVMHAVAGTTLLGEARPTLGRESMQLFVASKQAGKWRVHAVLNARTVPLEQQPFWDAYRALDSETQHEVASNVESLHARS